MRKLFVIKLLVISGLLFLTACGGGHSTPPTISVSITPSTPTNIDVGQTLNFTATVANDSGDKGVTWSISGTGCTGNACGTLTNTTSTKATYIAPATVTANMTVSIQATSAADSTKAHSANVVVSPEPTITTTSLASGTVGAAYNVTLHSAGGAGAVTWSLATGSALPAGMSLSTAGVISGTATTPGTTNFTVKVTDASGAKEGQCSQTQQLSLTIKPAVLTVTTTSLPNGVVGTAYSSSLATAGGTGNISWGVTAGSLPGGLTLSNAGSISGTPSAAGTFTFTVTATDSGTPAQTATQQLSITMNPKLTITTTSLAGASLNKSYSATLASTGGVGTISWTVTTGSLPVGLTLSTAGAISGTPTTAGTSNFTVTAKDSGTPQQSVQQALSITVTSVLTITTTTLPNGVVGTAYSNSLSAAGGTGTVTFSVTAGSLPAGVSLSTAGAFSGTPAAAGTFTFTVTATDSGSPVQTATQQLSITINPKLTITTTSLAGASLNKAYSATLASNGGVGTISWTVTTGSLPAGLTLSTAGAISGTPTTAGTSNFTVTAKDAGTPQQSVQQALSITVTAGLTITTTTLSNGTVNSSYSATLQSAGGTAPVTWSVTTGSLPAGLSMSTAGAITGTPTTAATSTFTVKVTDSGNPVQTATQQMSILVNPALSIVTTTLPDGTVGTAYSQNVVSAGGTLPVSWSLASGNLPAGLNIQNGSNGEAVIDGTPTIAASSTFTLKATDSSTPAANVSQQLTIVIIAPALVISTTTLPSGTQGTAYSSTLAATGGTTPYTWTVASGSLPAGLTLSGSGTSWKISGTPTSHGTSNFTLQVADSSSPQQTKTQSYSITIANNATLGIVTTVLPFATIGMPYNQIIQTNGGGKLPITWTLSSGSLPPGLVLDAEGKISGLPSYAGRYDISIMATDSNGCFGSANYELVVVSSVPPSISKIVKRTGPFRLRLHGNNFQQGIDIFIGGDPVNWRGMRYKNGRLIIIDGGESLKNLFPKDVPVSIKLVNPDGGETTGNFTR